MVEEPLEVVPYDRSWPRAFADERERILAWLPPELVGRVEHFGSTAVPGMPAKPVVDMLVEVADLEAAKSRIAPVLVRRGYDYLWRPTSGNDGPPFYAWFVRRDPITRARSHHIHMVERSFTTHWDRLLFRDYLVDHRDAAREYGEIKARLADVHRADRTAYTRGKTEFVERVTEEAKRWYGAVALRPVLDADLPVFFEHQADPVAAARAGFLPREREAFNAHWGKIRNDPEVGTRAVLSHGRLAGNVVGFEGPEGREVGYWIGREFWGSGVATRAVRAFLQQERARPLHAHVARANTASVRVLVKCGFDVWCEDGDDIVLRLGGLQDPARVTADLRPPVRTRLERL